ncbi:GNAT family N-acetyltransferase [Micromonospora purpureochromogenes]|uniref:Ribosomal protein S18 acetylase RimI-like enzyme n=1 Tax=Micromonospora purpureochromogenes TaxID=47872 RepID=A0ABX2RW53_9ACTN|nr:GNAT family N-acetyltransferase [Micromonospora purpureochromogenes]NYF59499.1 ribosomal protein S18 acetylase RimI-like enzyme [Micromonospora purpureochromogenes]
MPLHPDPGASPGQLLSTDDGTPLARLRLRDDDGERVAGEVTPLPGADVRVLAAQVRRDLAGARLETPDDALAGALVAGGLTLRRAATDMRHDLTDVPEPVPLPGGWSWAPAGWDDDLAEGLAAAYGPDHPDGRWQPSDTAEVRGMFERAEPVPPLLPASARVVGPDGRSAGHVLAAGPVPWTEDVCAWILNLGVAPAAQRRGLGRALLGHALRGARTAGLPRVGLSVADGNPARRMYEEAGFRPVARVLTVPLPDDDRAPDTRP